MSTRDKHTVVAGILASPILAFGVMPWFFGASGTGSVVSTLLFFAAWGVALAVGQASGRSKENPTPGGFGREAGLALVVLVLLVLAMAAPSRL